MAEPGFMDEVCADVSHWKASTASTIAAVHRNSLDPGRTDQGTWVRAYLALVGHPSVNALADIFPA